MPNKSQLGDLYTSNNEFNANVTLTVGNTSVNATINSTAMAFANSTLTWELFSGLQKELLPINIGLAASATASALTIALKGANGSDPSATNPVIIPFRNATEATGTPSYLTVTAATSLVVSSGSTLGVTTSTAFRLWVVGFNDAGTFRLGVINCSTCNTTVCAITSLTDHKVASSTAEGGAGAADSAGTFYTGTAVTSKAYRVLGFIEWSSTGLTAGTWTTTNLLRIQIFYPGVPLPGDLIQVKTFLSLPSDATSSATFVITTTTTSLTPTSAANIMNVTASGTESLGSGSGRSTRVQISRGNTNNTNLIGSQGHPGYTPSTGSIQIDFAIAVEAWDKPNTTSSQSYTVQHTAGGDPTNWGATDQAAITIREIMG